MTIDADKVPADIHTTVEGGLYKNADGQYVDAHGNVLDEKKDDDKEKIDNALAYTEAQAKKRDEQTANTPVLSGGVVSLTQAELDAKVQLAVAQALARQGAGVSPTTTASATTRGRAASSPNA